MSKKIRIPSYRLHKPSNQAIVVLDGHTHYLGKYDSSESRERYHRLVAEWLEAKEKRPVDSSEDNAEPIIVLELIHAYWQHVKTYYVKRGKPTSEQDTIRQALRFVRKLYGSLPARDFSPKALKSVREAMIHHKIKRTTKVREPKTGQTIEKEKVVAEGLSRQHINKQINRIKRMFSWGVEEELILVEVYTALQCVKGLRKGRSKARENPPVAPVSDEHIQAVLAHVPPAIATMIQVQRLCGCRPQEIVGMKRTEIDRQGDVWEYRPTCYKTEHHNEDAIPGRERVIFLGPAAQTLLTPYLKFEGDYLFSPIVSEHQRNAERRTKRKSPMTPSQAKRKPKGRKKGPLRECYDVPSYRRAIRRGCEKADIPIWHPNQLRHASLTTIRKRFGLEASKACGGHREISVTQHYAEQDLDRARQVMREIG